MLNFPHSDMLECRGTVTIYAKEVPSLYFENELMQDISKLGADFDIDLYLTE